MKAELEQRIFDFFDVDTEEDLEFFLDNGWIEEGGLYHHKMKPKENGRYRPKTQDEIDEEKRLAREHQEEMQRRWDEGERSTETLLWHSMQVLAKSYIQKLVQPFPWTYTNDSNEKVTISFHDIGIREEEE